VTYSIPKQKNATFKTTEIGNENIVIKGDKTVKIIIITIITNINDIAIKAKMMTQSNKMIIIKGAKNKIKNKIGVHTATPIIFVSILSDIF
jgi:hypothetical protein